ncbi:BgTH12-01455, partial [Blumeria graminis f. sp. triticale]
ARASILFHYKFPSKPPLYGLSRHSSLGPKSAKKRRRIYELRLVGIASLAPGPRIIRLDCWPSLGHLMPEARETSESCLALCGHD